ncbi:MAG TPA: TetR/AcrR family transcriptional regulator [Candidatus Binatia bacterium]|nr:TetR/AcrR family transcriptional regulator [Candidatus Binatia bacterium]
MNSRAVYHSPLRADQAAATRARILEAYAAVMRSGSDLTYGSVAAQAGVQERTVYRHFPTKGDLQSGLWNWILEHLTHADFTAGTTDDLVSSMRRSFLGFDRGAALIQAMLHSPQGLEVRLAQQAARRAMFEACVDDALPGLDPQLRMQVAAALQVLYSATSWELLRSFWGMDGWHAADAVEVAIRSLLAGLRARSQPGGAGSVEAISGTMSPRSRAHHRSPPTSPSTATGSIERREP